MNVIGNGVQKELKLNLQHNTTLFKTYKIILSGKLTTCFCLANKVPFPIKPWASLSKILPIPPTTHTTGRRKEEDLLYDIRY